MRQQPVNENSWTDADAMRLLRQFSPPSSRTTPALSAAERANRQAVLTEAVQQQVVPRLLLNRRPLHGSVEQPDTANSHPTAEDVAALTSIVINGTQPQAQAYVDSLCESGTSAEAVLLELLTPAARQLGKMWEDDTCDFAEVTIGTLRLANVMRLVTDAFAKDQAASLAGPRALLVQMPGEQHGLGLAMVVQFFQRAGWNVRNEPVVSSEDLVGIVKQDWFGIVGISVACSERLEALAADIRAIRKHSRNRNIGIMVGGPAFIIHPQLAALVGADATAIDGKQAVQQAESLVSLLACHR